MLPERWKYIKELEISEDRAINYPTTRDGSETINPARRAKTHLGLRKRQLKRVLNKSYKLKKGE